MALLPVTVLPVAIVWLAAAAGLGLAGQVVRHWRIGQPAAVDWIAGLCALPRRYLVDVHHVVARRPEAGRMHALMAGGLLAGSIGLGLGLVPALRGARLYWDAITLCFAVATVGAALVARRRVPHRPAHLSGGAFLRLPVWLGLYAGGGLVAAAALAVPARPSLSLVLPAGLAMGAGAAGLLAQLRRGPMRHAVAGALHLVAHPRPGRFGGRDTGLRPLDLAAPTLGVATSADFSWPMLAGFDACIQCGRCEQACPAFAAGQPLNPKALIQDLCVASRRDPAPYSGSPHALVADRVVDTGPDRAIVGPEARVHPDTLWACTTCRACVEECPMMIEHVDAVIALRRHQTLVAGAVPLAARLPLRELRYAGEPGGRALSARLDFASGLEIDVLGPGQETDILLWLGEGAYDMRYGRSLRALVRLMQLAGLRFAVLGEAEQDSGDLARRLGDEATFQRLAHGNVAALHARRFRRIVTSDPHAMHVLRNEYPAFGGNFTVLHHSALLDDLVSEGALVLARRDGPAVAYHDPCYLARYNGEIEAPRRLLDAACSTVVELERHGMRAMCCGGGGGAPVSDVPGRARIPDLRMDQVRDAGAAIVAVGCPGCTVMLEGVAGAPAQVRDLAELVLDAVVRTPAPKGRNRETIDV